MYSSIQGQPFLDRLELPDSLQAKPPAAQDVQDSYPQKHRLCDGSAGFH